MTGDMCSSDLGIGQDRMDLFVSRSKSAERPTTPKFWARRPICWKCSCGSAISAWTEMLWSILEFRFVHFYFLHRSLYHVENMIRVWYRYGISHAVLQNCNAWMVEMQLEFRPCNQCYSMQDSLSAHSSETYPADPDPDPCAVASAVLLLLQQVSYFAAWHWLSTSLPLSIFLSLPPSLCLYLSLSLSLRTSVYISLTPTYPPTILHKQQIEKLLPLKNKKRTVAPWWKIANRGEKVNLRLIRKIRRSSKKVDDAVGATAHD